MEWFVYLKFVLALGFVVGLIMLTGAALRMMQGRQLSLGKKPAARLELVEQRVLDARWKLAVVRWDDKEHLLLLGPQGAETLASGKVRKEQGDAA